jgi:hypothetical protein
MILTIKKIEIPEGRENPQAKKISLVNKLTNWGEREDLI